MKNHTQIVIPDELAEEIDERRQELGTIDSKGKFKKASYGKAIKDKFENPESREKRIENKCDEIKGIMYIRFGHNEELAHIMDLFKWLILYSMESKENHREIDRVLDEIIKQLPRSKGGKR